ncbi:TPA: ABC transporter permease [Raoultella ornithinolytica]
MKIIRSDLLAVPTKNNTGSPTRPPLTGREKITRYLPILTLVVLVALVSFYNPDFLKPDNIFQLLQDASTLFIMAIGMTFVIYIGGIDLSAQSIASMSTVVLVILLSQTGVLAIPLTLAFGAISGWVHTRFKISSFITTLAVGGIAYASGQVISGQRAFYIPGDIRSQTVGWMTSTVFTLPMEIIIAAVLLLLALLMERRTALGRHMKAIGAGESAALASGVKVIKVKIITFAIAGAFSAAAGVLLATRLSGASPTMADQFLLPAIVAVLLGGTPLTGGVGGVLSTLIGTLIVAVIRTSMTYLNVEAQAQQIFFGVLMIAAIAMTIDRAKISTVK